MIDKTKQSIQDIITKLPKDYQKVINSLPWEKISKEIGEKYLLTGSELDDFQIEVAFVLLGLEEPEKFESNIKNNIVLDKNETGKIKDDVFNKIFGAISISMEKNKIDNSGKIITKSNNTIIDQKFISLPENPKNAISKSDYQTKIYKLGREYGLHIDQIGVLEEIINKVISGNLLSTKFEEELKLKIKIPSDKLFKLITDINDSIFKDIRNKLESKWEEKKEIEKGKLQNKNEIVPIPPYKKEKESEIKTNSIGIDSIKEKMSAPSKSENVISDYSIPKMSSGEITEEGNKKEDIYREEI